ncbi:MAG TPA: hypothetical protein VK814_12290 [Acidobacteriaceae bacterium]|jgi:hypothetical protein|nr:hypothetical protein [Acidobacteriaceae bacterium]
MLYAKLDNPQTLNLYGYVGNNPLSRADADGHDLSDPDCPCQALDEVITHTSIVVHAALVNALVDIRDTVRATNGTEPAMYKEPPHQLRPGRGGWCGSMDAGCAGRSW